MVSTAACGSTLTTRRTSRRSSAVGGRRAAAGVPPRARARRDRRLRRGRPRDRRRRGAYGLYQGDTVARDYFHDRIVIFRDTLLRDFGHDPELLKAQVTRTVRHELAHHLGWGEKGVRGLGL